MRYYLLAAAAVVALTGSALAGTEVVDKTKMSFSQCKRHINVVSRQLGIEPIIIVNTGILYLAKYFTSDGEVLITCSKPDGTQLVTITK